MEANELKQTNDGLNLEARAKSASLHDRFWRGVTKNEAFNAVLYARVYGARRFARNVEIRSYRSIGSDLISRKMKARFADVDPVNAGRSESRNA